MDTWNLHWFGPNVIYGFVAAAVVCGLVIWWAGWATRDLKKW